MISQHSAAPLPDRAAIEAHKILRGIPYADLEPVLQQCEMLHLEPGDLLLSPDEDNKCLFLLMSGQLSVSLEAADSKNIFPIVPGECIGEMSIIENSKTSAWVSAQEASELVVMPEDVFWQGFMRLPAGVKNLLNLLTNRMRKTNEVVLRSLEERLRLEHIERELETAGKIQANSLPKRDPLFPNHPQVDVSATMRPARMVGGDFFDAIALDSNRIAVAVGDVSGKGMPAALFMVRVMTLLRVHLSEDRPLDVTLPIVNRMLCENNDEFMFVTLIVGVFDVTTGKLVYGNGGHNPPFIAHNNEPYTTLPLPPGVLMGIKADAEFGVDALTMQPGDTIMFYSDGVTEAENPDRDQLGVEASCNVLTAVSIEANVKTLVETLQQAIDEFSDGAPQFDDITMLALRYKGS